MSEAATVWMPQWNQEGEYAQTTTANITDPVTPTINITDSAVSSIIITDTGVSFTTIPATVFSYDPGS